MNASELIAMLAQRHAADVFVPECKDGPTQGCEHSRLDAWAMRKSWANPCCWGYEVKVSRNDFLRDEKWANYLPLCNELYFVAPKGVISPDEVPQGVGLLVVAGSRLVCKRKAPHRDVLIPDALWRYVLMCRAEIRDDKEETKTSAQRMEQYREWLKNKYERKQLALLIQSNLHSRMSEIETRNRRLEQYREATAHLEMRLRQIGVDPYDNSWKAKDQINKFARDLAGDFSDLDAACDEMVREVSRLKAAVQRCRETKGSAA
jgi:hypothetical protein